MVPKKNIVKLLFAINDHGGHLGHVNETIIINPSPFFPRRPHIKFDFNMRSCFKEKDV